MKVKITFQYWCCDHGYHGWHNAEIEVEIQKYLSGLIDVNLRGVGEIKCDTVVEFDAKKKTIRCW